MKKILLLLLSIFFISNNIFATTGDKYIFYLDNPTNKNIEITLDSNINMTISIRMNKYFFNSFTSLQKRCQRKNKMTFLIITL